MGFNSGFKGLSEVLPQNSPRGPPENHEQSQSRQPQSFYGIPVQFLTGREVNEPFNGSHSTVPSGNGRYLAALLSSAGHTRRSTDSPNMTHHHNYAEVCPLPLTDTRLVLATRAAMTKPCSAKKQCYARLPNCVPRTKSTHQKIIGFLFNFIIIIVIIIIIMFRKD